jgi:hypothetical protein
VVDLSGDGFFHSLDAPNQSIGYDFKANHPIRPTHYAIRSHPGWPLNSSHPKSSVIEVRNDPSNSNSCVEIDRRDNCPELNGPAIVRLFAIARPPSTKFRCIRLRQTSFNWWMHHYLSIAAFELFGELHLHTAMPQ